MLINLSDEIYLAISELALNWWHIFYANGRNHDVHIMEMWFPRMFYEVCKFND